MKIEYYESITQTDLGFTTLLREVKNRMVTSGLTMTVLLCAILSVLIIMFTRQRRNMFNFTILNESNKKLQWMTWSLDPVYKKSKKAKHQMIEM